MQIQSGLNLLLSVIWDFALFVAILSVLVAVTVTAYYELGRR